MWQVIAHAGAASTIAVVASAAVAVLGLVAWLIGLALALHDSEPADRPAILHAYATCRPWSLPRSRTPADPRRSVSDSS